MSVTIQNTSTHRIVVRLNSGKTKHLPPGAEVGDVLDAEVRGNAQIDRLAARGAVTVAVAQTVRSGDLTAREAAQHIRNTPVEKLKGFLSDDEDRKTVLQAWKTKHDA